MSNFGDDFTGGEDTNYGDGTEDDFEDQNNEDEDIYDENGELKEDDDEVKENEEEINEEDEDEDEEEIKENVVKITKSKKNNYLTSNIMTSYEYDRIIGIMVKMINTTSVQKNSFKADPILFEMFNADGNNIGKELTSSQDIAEYWVKNCRTVPLPININRSVGNTIEIWNPSNMILPTELDTLFLTEKEIEKVYGKTNEKKTSKV